MSVTRTLIRGTFKMAQLMQIACLVKSLCPEVGHHGEFRDWDCVYNTPPEVRGPKNNVRLRSHLVARGVQVKDHWPDFELSYLGIPDRRVLAPCEKRPVTTIALGKEAETLLSVLGCVFAYEYVRKGVRYRTRQGYTIDVYIINKLEKQHDPSAAVPLFADIEQQNGIVEIISESGATPEELTAFMQHLHPLVTLKSPPPKKGVR